MKKITKKNAKPSSSKSSTPRDTERTEKLDAKKLAAVTGGWGCSAGNGI